MTTGKVVRAALASCGPVLAVAACCVAAAAQEAGEPRPAGRHVTVGLFIASIEEGARIFTPVRLLPPGHPEALGHDFPTVQRFHGGEDALLVALGRHAGLLLAPTLQRYPEAPDTAWPYAPFERPPVERFASLSPVRLRAPLPGLRAAAWLDGAPVAFIIDTRGMSLAERGMTRSTSSGLDITRAGLLEALADAARSGPPAGPWVAVFERR